MAKLSEDFVFVLNNNQTCEYVTPLSSVELDVYDNVIEEEEETSGEGTGEAE